MLVKKSNDFENTQTKPTASSAPAKDQTLNCQRCNSTFHATDLCPSKEVAFCYICGYGHNAKWCLDVTCDRCKRAGHTSDQCWNNLKEITVCTTCCRGDHLFDECKSEFFENGVLQNARCCVCGKLGHAACNSRGNVNGTEPWHTPGRALVTNAVAAAVKGIFREKGGDDGSHKLFCCNCASLDHFFLDCFDKKMDENMATSAADASKYDSCELCGMRGHRQQFCPQVEHPFISNQMLIAETPSPTKLDLAAAKYAGFERAGLRASKDRDANFITAPRPRGPLRRDFSNRVEQNYRMNILRSTNANGGFQPAGSPRKPTSLGGSSRPVLPKFSPHAGVAQIQWAGPDVSASAVSSRGWPAQPNRPFYFASAGGNTHQARSFPPAPNVLRPLDNLPYASYSHGGFRPAVSRWVFDEMNPRGSGNYAHYQPYATAARHHSKGFSSPERFGGKGGRGAKSYNTKQNLQNSNVWSPKGQDELARGFPRGS